MDIRKALLVKSFRELLKKKAFLSHNEKRKPHTYPRGTDQNEYKFTVCWRYSDKPLRTPKSLKIRSTFLNESTLRDLLCKLKDQVAAVDKNNYVYEIDCWKVEVGRWKILCHGMWEIYNRYLTFLINFIQFHKLYCFYFLLNIIHNFIPHERVICDDRDLPWINKEI